MVESADILVSGMSFNFEHFSRNVDFNARGLPPNFLEAEERCGYYISADMKAVWAIQLDILKQILDICNRHQLRIWMAGGSLLGTVRHRGYVPWDDDIDLMMPRADYEQFCSIAPHEMPDDLFLQTQYSDPAFHLSMAKVRKNGTAAIDRNEGIFGNAYHMGIFVDIFPLDVFPTKESIKRLIFRINSVLRRIRLYANIPPHRFARRFPGLKRAVFRILCMPFRIRLLNSLLTTAQKLLYASYSKHRDWPVVMCPEWWGIFTGGTDTKRWSYTQDLLQETIYLPFEHMQVPVPKDYEEILNITYGDWKSFVRGGACHSGLVVDVKRSYREVLIEQFGYLPSDFK